MAREVTRRQLLGQAGTAAAGLAGLSAIGCAGSSAAVPGVNVVSDAKVVRGYHSFITRPDLQPPVITLARKIEGSQAHDIFLNAPVSGPNRGGGMILDPNGNLIWMGPDVPGAHKLDFNTQTYRGQPVLTWWEGVETHGWGQGVIVIADTSYTRKHTFHAVGKNVMFDHHEFNISAKDTALATIFWPHTADLTPIGGPKNASIVSGVFEELDIATGKMLFKWDSLESGVKIEDTYQPVFYENQHFGVPSNPFDYFHINSVSYADDGNILVSSRNTWCIYKISRKSGRIIWRMNGKHSDFEMGPGTHFYWQHHVRQHPGGIMTVFDNGASPTEEKQSRGLVLEVDEKKMRVTLKHQYVHPGKPPLLASAMGSCQLLPNGNVMVGWGTNSFFSEFSADGKVLINGAMTEGNPSYRVFAADWTGHPAGRPAVVAKKRKTGGKATVYVSWNGATEVVSWGVLAGKSHSSLTSVGAGRKSGFETALAVQDAGPYYAVQALDSDGHVLSTSATVKVH
jgi:hypothetical protein